MPYVYPKQSFKADEELSPERGMCLCAQWIVTVHSQMQVTIPRDMVGGGDTSIFPSGKGGC